jgi:hypothetical protein
MYHVQGVGNISQELAYSGRVLVGAFARGPKIDKKREKGDTTERIIQSVCPQVFGSAYARYGQEGNDGETAYPKCSLYFNRFENAGKEQPGGKRK